MDLRCLPRSLPTFLPTTPTHLRPTSPFFRYIPTSSSIKSLIFHSKPRFRATASSEETSAFVSDFKNSPNESAKDGIEEAPFEFASGEDSQEKDEAEGFINKANMKFDSDDTYSILIYGTGGLVALWLSSAVVGALDSIPLIPKVFEVVGLAYTIWFSYRYLLYKKNREELFVKIDDIKGKIGFDDI